MRVEWTFKAEDDVPIWRSWGARDWAFLLSMLLGSVGATNAGQFRFLTEPARLDVDVIAGVQEIQQEALSQAYLRIDALQQQLNQCYADCRSE